jgi:hypothetical protein
VARILTHRRDEHSIGKFYFSNREWIKKVRHKVYTASLNRFCCDGRVASCPRSTITFEIYGTLHAMRDQDVKEMFQVEASIVTFALFDLRS